MMDKEDIFQSHSLEARWVVNRHLGLDIVICNNEMKTVYTALETRVSGYHILHIYKP